VDYQGRPHAPLGRTGAPLGRVGYEVHGLGVEQVDLVVSGLEVAGAIYVPVPEDLETLTEYVPRGPGHLYQDGIEVLVAFEPGGLHDRAADMLA
jgi:hypothetical protein